MKTPYKKLNQTLKEYKLLQDKQSACFETELLPDIKTLNFERTKVFACLKNELDHFLNMRHYDGNWAECLVFYQTELGIIMAKDQILKKAIAGYRDELRQHMCDTSKQKTAIHGYARTTRLTDRQTIRFSG